ncbi:MAG: hypothetical protein IJ025_00605 [Clostridia bacterium]|nr:hypothetical protein [Clostridia bacterium]
MAEKKSHSSPEWFRLDNAGILFPGQNTRNWSNIFRFSIEMKEKIDPDVLKQALENIMPRFPAFNVRLRKGLFWYYLEKNPVKVPKVSPDIKNPCYRVKFKESDRFLFRVYYHGNHIAVDLFHAVSDGYGNSRFVCTLAAEYLRLKGHNIPSGGFVKNIREIPPSAELADDFPKYANSKAKASITDKHVYHPTGTKLSKHMVNMTCGIMSFDEIHSLAKAKGVTVTEFFAAIMLDIHCRKQLQETRRLKEVSVQIPINLRNVYPSETMRNFSICLMVKVDPNFGEYSFDELLQQVALQLRLARDEKKINATISKHVRIERNPFLKFLPLPVKNVSLNVATLVGAEQTTSVYLSNLGEVKLPDEMVPFIEKVLFVPGPGIRTAARCGIASFNGKLIFTIANCYEENDIEREFFTTLVKMGVHVKIESNRE